ncbi:MAG: tetratricopeptide repeat protein [Planctomycetota bacterium]|nr:tetratricopeptide repeat protein [Planctomycetota bacterium]
MIIGQRLDVAEAKARKLLWYSPDHSQGLLILGVSLNRQKKFTESIPHLERVKPNSEFYDEGRLTFADSLLNSGQFSRSEEVLVSYLRTSPGDIRAQNLLGSLYRRSCRISELIHLYETRLSFTPADATTLRELIGILSGNLSSTAVNEHLSAYDSGLQEPDILAGLARAAELQGNATAARSYFNRALSIAPTSPRVVLWCSSFLFSVNDYDTGSNILRRIPEQSVATSLPTPQMQSEYWHLRALVADHQENLKQSLKHCDQSLRYWPAPQTLSLKAGLLRRLSRFDEATAVTRQLAEIGKLQFEILKLGNDQYLTQTAPIERSIRISEVLEGLGYHKQAEAWKSLAQNYQQQMQSVETF